MASEQLAGTHTHFARRATGFVRDVKVRDAVIFNVLPACPGLVMAVSIFWVLSVFSQVNVYVAILITALCSFVISGAFGLLSQIMPRSGADYILISRALHPALAVGSSILIGTSSMIAMGYWGVFTAKICIGPMLTMVGVAADSSTLQSWGTTVTSNGWSMAIGLVEIAVLALVMAYGMRLMMRVQLWLFALGSIGFIVAAITLLTTSRSSFISSYNDYARPFTHRADTYHFFIAKAHGAGVNLSNGTDWHNTIVASGAFIAFGVLVWFSTNLAGEIRQAGTRKNWYSMLGGLAFTFVPIVIMVALLYHTVGQTFLTAVNGISGDPTVYTLPNAPCWITLVAAIHTNTLFVYFGIGSIIAGLFGAWLWFAYPSLGLPRAGESLVAQLFTSPFRGGLALVAADLIVGAAIYYAGKAWRVSQGIDLSLNYLEI